STAPLPRSNAVPVAGRPKTGTTSASPPHFATPEAAMRYLVNAYNVGDERAIWHVTNPDSRAQFEAEREWVKTFRFRTCTRDQGAHTFTCIFDITKQTAKALASADLGNPTGMAEVTVTAAPADRPGWYLLANQGCGG
ncbi:MAG: hypothetical protein QOJ62_2250, partial [Actinomycetota bacterium]|nr:hypothetical protein [Actinomycetota bacterium]